MNLDGYQVIKLSGCQVKKFTIDSFLLLKIEFRIIHSKELVVIYEAHF